jgi:MFS family permease
MYEQRERGTAVVFYSLAVVAGPTLGPIIGAAVSQSNLGWRWTEVSSKLPMLPSGEINIVGHDLLVQYLTVILTSVVVRSSQSTIWGSM